MVVKWQQHKAKQAKDWVRQEMKIHGESAKDFSLKLTGITNDREMHALIMQTILSKYAIYHPKSGRPAKITRLAKDEIIKLTGGASYSLPVYDNRHNELARTYDYLVKSSGLMSFLAKIFWLWGESEMLEVVRLFVREEYSFIEYLEELVDDDRTSEQYKFFDFIEKFRIIHPDYLDYSAISWIKSIENEYFESKAIRDRLLIKSKLSKKKEHQTSKDKMAVNKSIGRHYRKLNKKMKSP